MHVNHVLTPGKKMWGYTQRETPWLGEDPERTKRIRLRVCQDVVTRGDAFFRDLVVEDEKTFDLFGIVNRKNHR